jgi:hypothetical protein
MLTIFQADHLPRHLSSNNTTALNSLVRLANSSSPTSNIRSVMEGRRRFV